MARKYKSNRGKIIIKTADEIGIHSANVIRPPGGGEIPLDKTRFKGNVKAIGIKNTGWHLPGSEFVESKTHYATTLPAFSSREGLRKKVFAVLDNYPRIYKIPWHGGVIENMREFARKRVELANWIHKLVPAAKLLGVMVIPEVEFEEKPKDCEGLIVELHEFIGPKHTGKEKIVPKNLMEEHIENPNELLDVIRQITNSVTTLFDKGVLYTDTKPENFARDHNGTVKIVDLDAEWRRFSKKELKRIGLALARPANDLVNKNAHLRSMDSRLKGRLQQTVMRVIKKNIRNQEEARKISEYFKKRLRA